MFTGLIEEIGKLGKIVRLQDKIDVTINAEKVLSDSKIDDSIAVNGVCLTVVDIQQKSFTVQAVRETVEKTTILKWRQGEFVNLERAMKMGDRFGGHIVQGHVDEIGTISKINKLSDTIELEIILLNNDFVIEKGSIAIDGISLTIAKIVGNRILLAVIPHTIENTILKNKKVNDKVNIEFDFFAKYVQNYLEKSKSGLTEDRLKTWGYG